MVVRHTTVAVGVFRGASSNWKNRPHVWRSIQHGLAGASDEGARALVVDGFRVAFCDVAGQDTCND